MQTKKWVFQANFENFFKGIENFSDRRQKSWKMPILNITLF